MTAVGARSIYVTELNDGGGCREYKPNYARVIMGLIPLLRRGARRAGWVALLIDDDWV